jgi:RES domain-containing protein
MIGFRQVDARYPFLWEDTRQPAGRWHADGEGPAHYVADTPDGAWAEFLRHEEITDPEDLPTIRRQLWAIDIGDAPAEPVRLPLAVMRGGIETYSRCQQAAASLRSRGHTKIAAPSAALEPGGAGGASVHRGVHRAQPRDGRVIVIFGPPQDLVGWVAADAGWPAADLLERVNHRT